VEMAWYTINRCCHPLWDCFLRTKGKRLLLGLNPCMGWAVRLIALVCENSSSTVNDD